MQEPRKRSQARGHCHHRPRVSGRQRAAEAQVPGNEEEQVPGGGDGAKNRRLLCPLAKRPGSGGKACHPSSLTQETGPKERPLIKNEPRANMVSRAQDGLKPRHPHKHLRSLARSLQLGWQIKYRLPR